MERKIKEEEESIDEIKEKEMREVGNIEEEKMEKIVEKIMGMKDEKDYVQEEVKEIREQKE